MKLQGATYTLIARKGSLQLSLLTWFEVLHQNSKQGTVHVCWPTSLVCCQRHGLVVSRKAPMWFGTGLSRESTPGCAQAPKFIDTPAYVSRLDTQTHLQVHKVADYCSSKLKDQNYNVSPWAHLVASCSPTLMVLRARFAWIMLWLWLGNAVTELGSISEAPLIHRYGL